MRSDLEEVLLFAYLIVLPAPQPRHEARPEPMGRSGAKHVLYVLRAPAPILSFTLVLHHHRITHPSLSVAIHGAFMPNSFSKDIQLMLVLPHSKIEMPRQTSWIALRT